MKNDVWPVHVINLAANTVRMDQVQKQLDAQGIAFTRLDAVNGWDLPDEEIAKAYDADANARCGKQDLVPAEIGCYLSHIAAWRAIADGDADGGVVLEDDFRAGESLAAVLLALCKAPDRNWDMVKLFSINEDPVLIRSVPLVADHVLGVPDRVPSTTLGYVLTKDAAAALLAHSRPFFRPIDEDHKFIWEHGQRIALVHPSPLSLGEQEASTGTIGAARRQKSGGGAWRKLRYQVGYQLRRRLHPPERGV